MNTKQKNLTKAKCKYVGKARLVFVKTNRFPIHPHRTLSIKAEDR